MGVVKGKVLVCWGVGGGHLSLTYIGIGML